MMQYLVIDNGGTFLKYALMDESAKILSQDKVPSPQAAKLGEAAALQAYLDTLDSLVKPLLGSIAGIAFSTPGRIADDGTCLTAGAMYYLTGQNLAAVCRERYHLPVSVENDGKCAAQAELWKGSLQGVQNGITFGFGTGIAGGIIINGELYKGSHYSAGEFSLGIFDVERMEERGGRNTSYISTPALCRLFSAEDGEEVFARVESGDPEALALLDRFGRHVAGVLANIQSVLDVERVAIGGGISRRPELAEAVRRHMKDAVEPPYIQAMGGSPVLEPEIVTCRFYNEANLVGALYSLLKQEGRI